MFRIHFSKSSWGLCIGWPLTIQEPPKVKEAAERPAQNGNGSHKAVTLAANNAQYNVIYPYIINHYHIFLVILLYIFTHIIYIIYSYTIECQDI